MKANQDLPLTIVVENSQLVIKIGIDTLAKCFEFSEENLIYHEQHNDFIPEFKVISSTEFAQGVITALSEEREDGSTPITQILDKAFEKAVENDMGVEETESVFRHNRKNKVVCITKSKK